MGSSISGNYHISSMKRLHTRGMLLSFAGEHPNPKINGFRLTGKKPRIPKDTGGMFIPPLGIKRRSLFHGAKQATMSRTVVFARLLPGFMLLETLQLFFDPGIQTVLPSGTCGVQEARPAAGAKGLGNTLLCRYMV